jgi:hypothetical protein
MGFHKHGCRLYEQHSPKPCLDISMIVTVQGFVEAVKTTVVRK